MKFLFVLALCLLGGTTRATFLHHNKGGSKPGEFPSASHPPPPPPPPQPPVKGAGFGRFYSYGRPYALGAPTAISAPVYSTRQVEYVPVLGQGYQGYAAAGQPQLITVEPHAQPVQFLFKSQSSPLQLRQVHVPSVQPHFQVTRSQDLPQVVRHESYKPVVSELVETVVPYRNIVQVVKPVRENVLTVLPKQQQQQQLPQPFSSPVFRYNQQQPVFHSFFSSLVSKGKPQPPTPSPEPDPDEQQQQQEEEDEQQQEEDDQHPNPPPPPPPIKG